MNSVIPSDIFFCSQKESQTIAHSLPRHLDPKVFNLESIEPYGSFKIEYFTSSLLPRVSIRNEMTLFVSLV